MDFLEHWNHSIAQFVKYQKAAFKVVLASKCTIKLSALGSPRI